MELKAPIEFYAKGTRLDSACKDCKRERRRQAYHYKASDLLVSQLGAVINFIVQDQVSELRQMSEQLEELIQRCERRRVPPK